MSNLDVSKATGPDEIGNVILKETASSMAVPLCRLFNKCIDKGSFPDVWKTAQVTSLHKKGSVHLCENYRPISLLCCTSKVFEKLIYDQVYSHLTVHKLLSDCQSGFRPGDSTVNQLVSICHKIYASLDDGDEVLSVFLDFRKAVDKVWHPGLLHKLKKTGICGKLLSLFESYLSNRQQYVVIQGHRSNLKPIKAGVPQGSVLGPLLFLIFINDIHLGISSDIKLYADDTSLFRIVRKGNMTSAIDDLNRDLDRINKWCEDWLLELNKDRTVVLFVSRKFSPTPLLPIYMGNTLLSVVDSHKHLGVLFTANFTWSKHIDNCLDKATKRLNMLSPLKYRLPRRALELIYTTQIRPLLEYADIIIDNCSVHYHNAIENVQLSAARIVSGAKRRTSHSELYKELGWVSLAEESNINLLSFTN